MHSTAPRHAHHLRRGRYSQHGGIYLLTTVVAGRRTPFVDVSAGRLLVAELRAVQQLGWASSLAWVVMPDHLHWLVQLETRELHVLMRRVKGGSARRLNARLGWSGRFWQDGFHDRAIRREEDVRAVARYVAANPLRAGLVSRIGDYPLWDAAWL